MPSDDRETTIGAYEARTHFSELLERAAGGEELTITRNGTPIAKLGPVKRKTTPEERRAAFARMAEIAKGQHATTAEIKEWMIRGRR